MYTLGGLVKAKFYKLKNISITEENTKLYNNTTMLIHNLYVPRETTTLYILYVNLLDANMETIYICTKNKMLIYIVHFLYIQNAHCRCL